MALKFFFNFITSKHGIRYIDEPVGYDGADFKIEQESGRLARDVSYAGGENRLTIYAKPNHCFDEIMYNFRTYGSEAEVKFGVEYSDSITIIGEIDFAGATTNDVDMFEFTVVEENYKAKVKANSDVKDNILSNKDIRGNDLAPCVTKSVFVPAKPVIAVSEWGVSVPQNVVGAIRGTNIAGIDTGVNPSSAQSKYDIKDSLSFFSFRTALTSAGIPNLETFTYIRTQDNLRNITIDLSNINLTVSSNIIGDDDNIESVSGYSALVIRTGFDLETSTKIVLEQYNFDETESSYTFRTNHVYNIPSLERDEMIWIYLENNLDVEFIGSPSGITQYILQNAFLDMDVKITATSIAFNVVVPMIRIVDAMRRVVKSTSELNIQAPRWDTSGQFNNQYVTSTPLLRNIEGRPFNISFKDIVDDWLPEVFGDYLLKPDGTVYFGIYQDFYRNFNGGDFTQYYDEQGQIDGFKRFLNSNFVLNQFKYGYKNYASQKENEQANTYDLVHGESESKLPNERAKDSYDVEVGLIRDAFYIQQQINKGFDISDSSATQDDDKAYAFDVVELTDADRTYTETANIQHRERDIYLELVNDQSFRWTSLGLSLNDTFQINNTANQGTYEILEITDNTLYIRPIPYFTPTNILASNTTFTYTVTATDLKARTYEGFDYINNIEDGYNYVNLRYTVKRNILNYYNSYLATACFWRDSETILNTVYNNNPEAETLLNSGEDGDSRQTLVVEGAPFTPTNPILSPYKVKFSLIMTQQQWFDLQDLIRAESPYIVIRDADGVPCKVFMTQGTWTVLSKGEDDIEDFIGIAECEGEEKYEPFIMSIFGTGNGMIIINEDEIIVNSFKYDIDRFEKLHIFDETGKLLYVPIPYDRVRVNNSGQAESVFQLAQWLNTLK